MTRKKRSYGEITRLILEKFADILIETKQLNRPNIFALTGNIIKLILKETKNIKRYELNKAIKDLEKREIFYIEKKDGDAVVHLRERGRQKVIRYSLEKILSHKLKEKKWNGKWFLVFFDVPEIQRNKRDYLRRFLSQLGFYRYQKSVYIFPYECEKEVALIKKIVEGAKYMRYIVADKIEEEDKLKAYFRLGV